MTSYQAQVLKVALDYYDDGLCVIPVPYATKGGREYSGNHTSRRDRHGSRLRFGSPMAKTII